MKKLTKTLVMLTLLAVPTISYAGEGHGNMKGMDHGNMKGMDHGNMKKMGKNIAVGKGTINSVDAEKNYVNISHGPIPALKWPEMTMDLPVADGIDLSEIKAGNNVDFSIELGADKVYRITKITPATP